MDRRKSIGGALRDVFSVDITVATGRCAGCGNTGPLAEGRIFSHSPGLVLRCPACGETLLRLTRAPGHVWLDMRGLEYIELAAPEQALAGLHSYAGWIGAIAAWRRDASRTVRRCPDDPRLVRMR
jgi:Family of unknown function (DUF6510)